MSNTLLHQIRHLTSRRIDGLRVDEVDGRFVVRGSAPSFYVKQLALTACRRLLGDDCSRALVCEIEVR